MIIAIDLRRDLDLSQIKLVHQCPRALVSVPVVPFVWVYVRERSTDLWHILLHTVTVAFDALLEMLGDIMDRVRSEPAFIDRGFDLGGKRIGAVCADLARRKQRLIL